MLAAKLRKIRDLLIKAGRITPCRRVQFCNLADWADEGAERITFLESAMRSANEAIRALIDDDRAKTAQITDLKAQLATAQADALSPENRAAIDELVPEVTPAEPAPQA